MAGLVEELDISGFEQVFSSTWHRFRNGDHRSVAQLVQLVTLVSQGRVAPDVSRFDFLAEMRADLLLDAGALEGNPALPALLERMAAMDGHPGSACFELKVLASEHEQTRYLDLLVLMDDSRPVRPKDIDAWESSRSPRTGVASNPSMKDFDLHRLSNDPSWAVRWRVALNPSTPDDLREKFSRDPAEVVQEAYWQHREAARSKASTR